MRMLIAKPRLGARLLLGLLLLLIVWTFGSYHIGMLLARWDLARDHYEVKMYGRLTFPPFGPLRIGESEVNLGLVGGCMTPTSIREYARGYNAVSIPALKERFGPDSLGRIGL